MLHPMALDVPRHRPRILPRPQSSQIHIGAYNRMREFGGHRLQIFLVLADQITDKLALLFAAGLARNFRHLNRQLSQLIPP